MVCCFFGAMKVQPHAPEANMTHLVAALRALVDDVVRLALLVVLVALTLVAPLALAVLLAGVVALAVWDVVSDAGEVLHAAQLAPPAPTQMAQRVKRALALRRPGGTAIHDVSTAPTMVAPVDHLQSAEVTKVDVYRSLDLGEKTRVWQGAPRALRIGVALEHAVQEFEAIEATPTQTDIQVERFKLQAQRSDASLQFSNEHTRRGGQRFPVAVLTTYGIEHAGDRS
jgi:hypothetical protein